MNEVIPHAGKRILLIPSWYKTSRDPSAGSFFEEQARALQKAGHQVTIFYPERSGFLSNTRRYGSLKRLQFNDDKGLPTYHFRIYNLMPNVNYQFMTGLTYFLNSKFLCVQANWAFRKILRSIDTPDIIHSHSAIWGGVIGNYLASKYKLRHVITEHSSKVGSYTTSTINKILSDVYQNTKYVVAVSNNLRRIMIDNYDLDPAHISVVPNVLNPVFSTDPRPITLSSPFRFAIIGHLVKLKNHISLIKAIKILLDRGVDIQLDIVGEGVLGDELSAYLQSHSLENQIFLHGVKSRQEVAEIIKDAHAVISVSFQETFGVTLIEGLATGRPVLSTNSGGPADIVNASNGLLINGFTADDIAKGIQEFIENYENFDQIEIRKNAIEKYSEKALIHHLDQLYND